MLGCGKEGKKDLSPAKSQRLEVPGVSMAFRPEYYSGCVISISHYIIQSL